MHLQLNIIYIYIIIIIYIIIYISHVNGHAEKMFSPLLYCDVFHN